MRLTAMDAPGWLSRHLGEVPPDDGWLGEHERRTLAALRIEPRRAAWRLGRWTAKAALSAWLDISPRRIEVIAAHDGAPEAWVDGVPAAVSLSLSHRGPRAIATVADRPAVVGCDVEIVEPRSAAFVREWLAAEEQELVAATAPERRDLLVNLLWSAKEAAAKVRREGLRLDVRHAVVTAVDGAGGGWQPLNVRWDGDRRLDGWWRADPGWVIAVAGLPPPSAPAALAPPG